ncbi:MAG: galactokinase [Myxococcales bacterium]|nr:galactokinase [Myxococcales bacterium]
MRSRPWAPAFPTLFGAPPSTVATAPGRVNLLGEHTDYNLGWVLPTAIPQRTQVELRLHSPEQRRVRVSSSAAPLDDPQVSEYRLGHETPTHRWLDYVQGVTQILQREGVALPGLDLRITSDVPLGSGLSSSAALLVALFRALKQALALSLSDVAIARLCQRVENDFVGAPVGILDPMACGLCQPGQALFLDTRDLSYQTVPLPSAVELVVIHSGIVHSHGRDANHTTDEPVADYRVRRGECEQAAALLGCTSLRQLQEDRTADARIAALPAPLAARVRHVRSENDRVLQAVALLQKNTLSDEDLHALAGLFAASHRSQSEDYQVSLPAIDVLVALSGSDPGIVPGAARLTGGGFGGSIVALARSGHGFAAAARIAAAYQNATGHPATILVPQAAFDPKTGEQP